MKKLIEHGEYYNPYIILDRLEVLLTELGLYVNVVEEYKSTNRYHHIFSSGMFRCTITNSQFSSSDFDILIRVYQKGLGWKELFNEKEYNLVVKPNYEGLLSNVKKYLNEYCGGLELPAQRAVKISNIIA